MTDSRVVYFGRRFFVVVVSRSRSLLRFFSENADINLRRLFLLSVH